MIKWEYKFLSRRRGIEKQEGGFRNTTSWDIDLEKLEQIVTKLGNDGWELVEITSRSDWGGGSNVIVAGVTTTELWVFKRPKQ